MNSSAFDFIIVGAGTAGCTLANRLTEDAGIRVLLLEAGGRDWDPMIHVPIGVGSMWKHRTHDWGYNTEPQANLNNRVIELPRGKVLGGSSSINAMVYLRGDRGDYDRWASNGLPEWSYANVLPYFKKSEAWIGGENTYRGGSGPVGTRWTDPDDPVVGAVLDAARQAGYPITDDINGEQGEGFARTQSTLKNGHRSSAAATHLRQARGRTGLKIESGAAVTRVLIDNGHATGVEYRQGSATRTAHAAREVILCGGAINTPQLLLCSGVGDPLQLAEHGIKVIHALQGVGQNLQDHVAIGVGFARKQPGPLAQALRFDRIALAMLRAYFAGTGVASNVPGGPMALLRTRPDLAVPDLQFAFRSIARDAAPWFPGLTRKWRDFCVFVPALLHPQSRGSVTLASSDPLKPPRIQPNFLSVDADFLPLMEGIRLAREVARQPALAGFLGDELFPGPKVDSAEAMRASIRNTAGTFHHACSTCRMGRDDNAVVEPDLRVRGIKALRVVDASVLPDLPGANINACTFMIAEKAADLIRGRPMLSPAKI
ncbi:MAG: GMC family oxidoreductase [Burkholderiales bacterium]